MNTHEHYMQIALELAKKGAGKVSPNPMVGCVIVKNGEIIGKGWHQVYGGSHAEPNAIANLNNESDVAGSDVYVTLEPCAHFGLTPPCANLLVGLKPKQVIIGSLDDNPLVGGKGIKLLESAEITVITGILEAECRQLNKRFFCNMTKNRPYVVLKWARSADGFIALPNYKAVAISGLESNIKVHQMRAEEDAILVGFKTAFYDNPSLTVRLASGKNPLRLFIDKDLKLPSSHHLVDQSTATICFNSHKTEKLNNLEYIKIGTTNYASAILALLQKRKISSVLVEGGTTLLQSFIDLDLWDEAVTITNKEMLQNGIKAPNLANQSQHSLQVEDDKWEMYFNSVAN
jgi:diaminohydroxyphosphoribosylaminopyrimidine deaminase / 5-amino-6-(5-phosphoribosylamino)uracil reductase